MEHIITRILQATAWPMDPPAPYSPFHLCLLLAGIPLSILAACAAAGSRKGKMAGKRKTAASWDPLLFFCGLLLAISEIYKQLFLYEIVNGGRYDWWYFPFQLCSIPMYLCLLLPLLSFSGLQSLRLAVYTFLQDFGLLGGVMALLDSDPSRVFMAFHADFPGTLLRPSRQSRKGNPGLFQNRPLVSRLLCHCYCHQYRIPSLRQCRHVLYQSLLSQRADCISPDRPGNRRRCRESGLSYRSSGRRIFISSSLPGNTNSPDGVLINDFSFTDCILYLSRQLHAGKRRVI